MKRPNLGELKMLNVMEFELAILAKCKHQRQDQDGKVILSLINPVWVKEDKFKFHVIEQLTEGRLPGDVVQADFRDYFFYKA